MKPKKRMGAARQGLEDALNLKQPQIAGAIQRVHSLELPVYPQVYVAEFVKEKTSPKFCVDCAHCDSIAGVQFFCKGGSVSLITGKPVTIECADMRRHNGECGPDGRLFKQADALPV